MNLNKQKKKNKIYGGISKKTCVKHLRNNSRCQENTSF